jgi:hypothetical protein
MVIYLRIFEERRLLKDFGSEYIDYRNRVSMIFPLKLRKDNIADIHVFKRHPEAPGDA